MDKEFLKVLSTKDYYIILADATGKPFIGDNKACYLFDTKVEASVFIVSCPGTRVGEKKHYNVKIDCRRLYDSGIERICIKRKQEEMPVIGDIDVHDLAPGYHNLLANQNLNLLQQTKKSYFLRELKKCKFLAPIKIDPRAPKHYPAMHYSYALIGDGLRYFVLFSTLDEFETWNESQGGLWKAIELGFERFGRIRKHSPVIINPISQKIVLTEANIKKMMEEKKNEHV